MKENFSSFFNRIALDDLPNTFRDASKICKRLGVRYLWDDCLCIIQDSKEDWQVESAKMDNTYRNAWCSIAATKAQDLSGGCFTERALLDIFSFDVEANIDVPVLSESFKGL